MKNNTKDKSSITLPYEELVVVEQLMRKLKMKSKVAVIRRGIELLQQKVDADLLREKFKYASELVSKANLQDVKDLDRLSDEGVDD